MAARTVSVIPFDGSTLVYGFKTTVSTAVSNILGHETVSVTTPVANLVFGSSRPKPRRASRFNNSKFESSFVDVTAIDNARTNNFSVGQGKPFGSARGSIRSSVHYVTVNGIKYAWSLPARTRELFGTDLGASGVRIATASDNDLVFGANFPKPPQISKAGANGNFGTTFADPSRLGSLPGGVNLISSGSFSEDDIPF